MSTYWYIFHMLACHVDNLVVPTPLLLRAPVDTHRVKCTTTSMMNMTVYEKQGIRGKQHMSLALSSGLSRSASCRTLFVFYSTLFLLLFLLFLLQSCALSLPVYCSGYLYRVLDIYIREPFHFYHQYKGCLDQMTSDYFIFASSQASTVGM